MRDDSLRAAAVLPLLVLTSLRLSAAPSGMCPITIVECDRPRSAVAGQGGLGSGACVGFTTDECGSTKIDLLDENGRAVFLPLMLSQGQTVVTACRAVADMDTSGLRLDEVRLDDPVVAAAMGGAGGGGGGGGAEPLGDLGALAGNLQDALNILGTLGGEVCVTLTDAHISSEVTQACVTATLKVGGNVIDSVPPISVGCWDDGLACHNATSCDECTTMAETMRAAGSYGGAASCGWCGTTNECVLGGTRGPRCDSCDAWTWTTATALCPSATPGGAQGEAAEHDSCVAQSMTSTPLRPSKPSSSTSSDTDCEEQDAHAGLPAVGFFAIGLLGFLGGSCCGAPVGEVMRVLGHRLCPDCVPDPYKQKNALERQYSGPSKTIDLTAARANGAGMRTPAGLAARGDGTGFTGLADVTDEGSVVEPTQLSQHPVRSSTSGPTVGPPVGLQAP